MIRFQLDRHCIDDNVTAIENELRATKLHGIDNLIAEIERTDFFSASCNGHDNYRGGTANHSLWTLFDARRRYAKDPKSYGSIKDSDLVIACLLHDLGDTRKGYPQFSGHGYRAANILRVIKEKYGLDISVEVLAAIRFHLGKRPRDNYDKTLYPYKDTPLAKLLRKADHTAAGVFDFIPFGSWPKDLITTDDLCPNTVYRDPSTGRIYFSANSKMWESYPMKGQTLDLNSFRRVDGIKEALAITLYHMWLYDIIVLKRQTEGLGLFTLVRFEDQCDHLYRSDGKGFGYKSIVVFKNRYPEARKIFILTEDINGIWSVVRVSKYHYHSTPDFLERNRLLTDLKSEDEALNEVRHMKKGVDLREKDYFARIPVTSN